jgi:transcription elongation factor Elf1
MPKIILKRQFVGFTCPRCGHRKWKLYEVQDYIGVSLVKRKVGEYLVCANCDYKETVSE